ncbi:MAG: prepilin peptidase [Coriobacteriaceae bacterium]|nr:prepilin peptidase [Coriobacteriaceae bacterium]
MDDACATLARLLAACVLGACVVGGAGRAAARRELGGWPARAQALVGLCGALAGVCAGAVAAGWLETAELLALAVALVVCSAADLGRRIIPNRAVAAIVAVRGAFLGLEAVGTMVGGMGGSRVLGELGWSLMGGAAVSLALGVARLLWAHVRDGPQQGIGGGDAKLLSACGMFLGPVGGLACVALSCLLALACCAGAWASVRARGLDGPIPKAFPLAPQVFASVLFLSACRAF